MPLPFELTAENVVKYGKEKGVTFERGSATWQYPQVCARSLIVHAAYDMNREQPFRMYSEEASEKVGLSNEILVLIEAGFEGYDATDTYVENDPYFKMGQEIYRLSR